MTKHMTTEHGSSSAIELRNKPRSIGQHLKSISISNFIPSLIRHKSSTIPTEAKLFLLICSIFPDTSVIPFEDLAVCMMGSGLFEDVHDMFAARSRIHDFISIINDKKSSGRKVIGILKENDGPLNQHVIVLDSADLAKSIPRSYPFVFRREVIVGKWPESNMYKDYYGLSLVLNKVNEYTTKLECPKLALLQLKYKEDSQDIPIDFFEEMEGLRVLSLDIPSLPQSINALRNLRNLRLKVTKFEDVSSIGSLLNLEFLSISVLSSTEVPREIGQLGNLKFLDLRRMNITYFPPGVLSRLLKLEELYLPLNFKNWGCKAKNYDDRDEFELEEQDGYGDEERIDADIGETDDQVRINTSLVEIVSSSLNTLQVCVPKASVLPKSSPVFKNLREFRILKPSNVICQSFGKYSINVLQLTGEVSDIKESGICDLFNRAEDLNLTRVQNMKNVLCQLEENGSPNLKKMIVSECNELEYIVDGTKMQILSEGDHLFRNLEFLQLSLLPNLKEICNERWRSLRCFSNLRQISISFCPKLKYLFPLSIVDGLTLTRIEIVDCDQVEGIFCEDKKENIPVTLCSIENLEMYSLPRLISLLVCKDKINEESLATNKNIWSIIGAGEYSKSQEESISKFSEEIICLPPALTGRANVQEGASQRHHFSDQVSAIKKIGVVRHLGKYSLLPSRYVAKWFKHLKRLKIAFCDSVKVIFLFAENHATSKAFNSLEVLELHGLRNLVHICYRIPPKITAFKNLQLLVLSDCDILYLLSYRVAKLLVQLQKVCISRCEKMEELITVKDDENEIKGRIVLPRLKHLELQQLPNLRVLFGGPYEIELPSLESVKLKQCNEMKLFSNGLMKMPMLEGVEVDGIFQLLRKDLNVIIKGFTLADLKIATKDFSSDTFLGEGASGRVYKGWIDEKSCAPSETGAGFPVAIKRLKSDRQDVVRDLTSEADILSRKSHPNLVNLLGWCNEGGEFLLVYEFIPWGRLSDHLLTGNIGVKPLSWDMRIKIAIGVARGLDFLHTSRLVHRDVKVSNILVDKAYNAKISSLTITKLMPVDGQSEVSTRVRGTFGYLDPAYAMSGRVSLKSDVYSFGVVLLELMTGLKALDKDRPKKQIRLVQWLRPILSQERELSWWYMDSTMDGQYSSEALSLMTDLILECLQEDRTRRPTIAKVLDKLLQIDAFRQ